MAKHRKGDKSNRGQGGSTPDPSKIRWRVEWHDEDGKSWSEAFNSRVAVDDKVAALRKRGLQYHIVNV